MSPARAHLEFLDLSVLFPSRLGITGCAAKEGPLMFRVKLALSVLMTIGLGVAALLLAMAMYFALLF